MRTSSRDERRAACFLRSRGLTTERFPKAAGRGKRKTPDFRVSTRDDVFFFCEVKSVLTKTGPEGILHSTIYNSLTENIHDAVKQFGSVNSTHSVPNVLLWISHNMQINVHTFLDLMKGHISIEDILVADLTKFRDGRMAREANDIDLHIWLESDGTPQFVFNGAHRHLFRQLRRVFG